MQAYMHNYNIVYIVLFFVFAVAGSSCLLGRLNIYKLQLKPLPVADVFAGRSFDLSIAIVNEAASDSYALYLQDRPIDRVEAKGERVVTVPKRFASRGRHAVGKLRLTSYFPFGHIRFYKEFHPKEKLIVYPRPKGKSLQKSFQSRLQRFGQLDSFDRLRSYDPADQLSHIHWPSVAKGQLQSKKFHYSMENRRLEFDFYRAGQGTEQRLSQLTLWVLQAYEHDIDFVLRLPKETLYKKRGQKDAILEKLALY